MSVIGIVSEFNPFHNGHKYLIDSVKKDGDIILCLMSGNFVQRAEPAIFDKRIRTLSALKSDADFVFELPFVYATATAEIFAENAVRILCSLGCDKIAFGVEDENGEELSKAAKILLNDDFNEKVMSFYSEGLSYPAARQKAFDIYDISFDISKPNNILALEYLKAIYKNNYDMSFIAIKRQGEEYTSVDEDGELLSAGHIRQLIKDNIDFTPYIPSSCKDIYLDSIKNGNYTDEKKFDIALMALLKNIKKENLSEIAYMSEGLENKIYDCIQKYTDLRSIYDNAKSKRYTHSRIRRAVLSLAFGISKDDIKIAAPYCRLLGFNTKRTDVLGQIAKESKLPYIVSFKDKEKFNSEEISRLLEIEIKTTEIFKLAERYIGNDLSEMTYSPVKI